MSDRDSSRPSGLRPLKIEPFDPGPSIRIALEILEDAAVPFALAGRIAVWAWVDDEAMKMATGDSRDERDVLRLLGLRHLSYERARAITRQHAGPAAAMRLDRLGAQVGRAEATRYVVGSEPKEE